MGVLNYPITLGFRAVFYPYYGPPTARYPNGGSIYPGHHGIDWGTPIGTPVVINGQRIADTGKTGIATGPHIHIDKHTTGSRAYSGYRNPSDWSKIKGTVIFAGPAGTAGNMIKIKATNGHIYRFLHLNKIYVKVGQKVGYNTMKPTKAQVVAEYRTNRGPKGKKPTAAEINLHSTKGTMASLSLGFKKENDKRFAAVATKDKAQNIQINNLKKRINVLVADINKGKVKLADVEKQLVAMETQVAAYEKAGDAYEQEIEKLEAENLKLKEGIKGFLDKLFEKLFSWVNKGE